MADWRSPGEDLLLDDALPPLPQGFTLDEPTPAAAPATDAGAPAAEAAMPPLPAGFTLDPEAGFGADVPVLGSLVRGVVTGGVGAIQDAGTAADVFKRKTGGDKNSLLGQIGLTIEEGTKGAGGGYQRQVPSLADIDWSATKAGTYLLETIGSGVASTFPSLATGAAGAAITGAVAGPEAAPAGAWLGSAVPAFISGVGGAAGDLARDPAVAQALKDGKVTQDQLDNYALGAGALIGAFDVAGTGKLINITGIGKQTKEAVVRTTVLEAVKRGIKEGVIAEGPTEAAQQLISEGVQAYLGGDLALGKRLISIADSFIGGVATGGTLGGPAAVIENQGRPKPAGKDDTGVNPATPPGVADSPEAGVPSPGGVAATTPPPPAGDERAAPAAGTVTAVEPGMVSPDVGAALSTSTQQPTAQPAPAPVSSLPASAPVIAEEEVEPAAPVEPEEEDPAVVSAQEASLQEALRSQAERQAAATPVTAPGADLAAALAVAAPAKPGRGKRLTTPEPAPTPQAAERIAQPEQVPPAAPGAILQAPSVAPPETQAPVLPAAQAAAAPPAVAPQESAAQSPLTPAPMPPRARLRALGYTPEQILELEPAEMEEILAREAPQPGVELTQPSAVPAAPVTDNVPPLPTGFTLDPVTAAEPQAAPPEAVEPAPVSVAAPEPPRPPAPVQQAARPKMTMIGRQLAERVRQDLESTLPPQLAERADLAEAADTVAHELTQALPRGTAPSQAVENLIEQAAAETRRRLTDRQLAEMQAEQAVTTRQEAAQETSKQTQATARTEGAPQERARVSRTEGGKTKTGKEFAAQGSKALRKRVSAEMAKPEAEREPHLARIAHLMEIRATKHPREKALYTERIAEEVEKYAAALTTREAEVEAAKPKEAPKPQLPAVAAEPGRELTVAEKTELARDEEIAKQRERANTTTALVKPVTSVAEDFDFPNVFTPKAVERAQAYIKDLVARINAALGKTELLNDVSPKKTGPEENFAIWLRKTAKRLARDPTRTRTETAMIDIWKALKFLKEGDTANLYGQISDAPIDARAMTEGATGQQDYASWAATQDEDQEFDLKPATMPPRTRPSTPGAQTVTLPDANGKPTTLTVLHEEKAGSLLRRMARIFEASGTAPKGGFGLFRRMHYKALRNLVGDLPVYMVDHESMSTMTKKPALGMYAATDPATNNQFILLNYDAFAGMDEQTWAETLGHEMTHAATIYALHFNIAGTQQIVAQLRTRLQTQLRNMGVFDQLTGDGKNAFKNDREFIAEAYNSAEFQELLAGLDVSPHIAARIGRLGEPKLTWWRSFAAAVANALGFGGSRPSITYFEATLALHPHLAMSRAEQAADYRMRLHETTALDSFDPAALKPFAQHARDTVMQSIPESWSNLKQAGLWTRLASTQELVRRAARHGTDFAEAFKAHAHAFLGGRKTFETLRDLSDALAGKLARYRDTHHQAFNAMQEIAYAATNAGIDPSDPLHKGNNSHVFKKGPTHAHLRAIYQRLKPLYDALPAEAKALYRELGAHYVTTHDRKMTETLRTMVEGGIAKHGTVLPAGEDANSVIKWIMDGDIDRPAPDPALPLPQPGTRTKRDEDLHKALGGLAKSLTGSHELRKVKGYYVPLTRDGKYFLAARETIKVPPGAFRRPGTGDDVEMVFAGPSAQTNATAYTSTTDDQISRVISEWRDKTTFAKSHPKDVNAEQIFRVQVQNRVFEMHDNQHHLERRGDELAAAGYKVEAVAKSDRLQGRSEILPSQINRLIRNAEQATVGQVTAGQKAVVGGIIAAYIKQLSGSRAGHRRLKRNGVEGFDRDLVDSTYQVGRTDAGHIANLERSREMAKTEKTLYDVIKSNRQARKTGTLPMQAMAFELSHRITQMTEHGEDSHDNPILKAITDISFVTHLGGLGYSFSQLAQIPMMAYPVLARHFGEGATWRALAGAVRDIQLFRVIGRGVVETGKAAVNIGRYKRQGYKYEDRVRARLGALKNGPLLQRAADELERLNFGVGAGLETSEVSEHGKNLAEKAMSRTVSAFRQLPAAMEVVNRYVTLIAAVNAGKRAGLTDQQIIDRTVDIVEQSQGGYGRENNPAFFEGKYGKVAGQFKKFSILYGQLYYGAVRDVAAQPGERVAAAKQLVRLSAMTSMFAGVGGLAFMEMAKVAILAANLSGLSDDDWEDWENGLQSWFAGATKWALGKHGSRSFSEVVLHGLPRLLGFDASSRLGNDNLVLFGEARSMDPADFKSWLYDMMVGAPGGTVTDFALKHDLPYPKVARDLMKTWEDAQAGHVGAAISHTAGFRTAKEAGKYEAFGEGYASRKEYQLKDDRSKLMGKYWDADPGADRRAAWREVQDWNRSHKSRDEKIEYGDLQRSRRTREQQERKKKRKAKEYQ